MAISKYEQIIIEKYEEGRVGRVMNHKNQSELTSPIALSYFLINVNENYYKIENIYIINEKGEKLLKLKTENFKDLTHDKTTTIKFKGKTYRRLKPKYDKQNFIIKSTSKGSVHQNPYDIYIYYKNIDYEYKGKKVKNIYDHAGVDVRYSDLVEKHVVGGQDVTIYVKNLVKGKWELENKVKQIIKRDFLSECDMFCLMDEDVIKSKCDEILKLNRQIRRINDILISMASE